MITAIVGPMFSGKTTELCRRLERARLAGKRVALLRPERGIRRFLTHNGMQPKFDERIISDLTRFDPTYLDVIGLDEGQFCPELMQVVEWANAGLHVIVAGLLISSEQEPFTNMLSLVAVAEEIIKLNAVCQRCGSEYGSFTHYTAGRKTQQILVGGADLYEALCRDCYNAVRRQE